MSHILFPENIPWQDGTLKNLFVADDNDLYPNMDKNNAKLIMLFDENIDDETGRHTATVNGSIAGYSSGIEFKSIKLEGSSYLDIDNPSDFTPPILFLVSIKAIHLSDAAPVIKTDAYELDVYSGTLRVRIFKDDGTEEALTVGIDENIWFKVGFWVTDTEFALLKNGNIQTQSYSGNLKNITYLHIGGFDGYIDTLYAYSVWDDAMIDVYMDGARVPVPFSMWNSPVIDNLQRPLDPQMIVGHSGEGSYYKIYSIFKYSSGKPAGTYEDVILDDGNKVQKSLDAEIDGDWQPFEKFDSIHPTVYQLGIVILKELSTPSTPVAHFVDDGKLYIPVEAGMHELIIYSGGSTNKSDSSIFDYYNDFSTFTGSESNPSYDGLTKLDHNTNSSYEGYITASTDVVKIGDYAVKKNRGVALLKRTEIPQNGVAEVWMYLHERGSGSGRAAAFFITSMQFGYHGDTSESFYYYRVGSSYYTSSVSLDIQKWVRLRFKWIDGEIEATVDDHLIHKMTTTDDQTTIQLGSAWNADDGCIAYFDSLKVFATTPADIITLEEENGSFDIDGETYTKKTKILVDARDNGIIFLGISDDKLYVVK